MKTELREFDGNQFSEAYETSDVDDLSGFEDYCDNLGNSHALSFDVTVDIEDEQARPYQGIVAGRQFTIPGNDDRDEKSYSMFLYK